MDMGSILSRQEAAIVQGTLQMIVADVIGPSLEQSDPDGGAQRLANRWDVT